jgi:plasmid stabilization system protein ParE
VEHKGKVYKVIIDPAANDRMYEHFEFLARVSAAAANRLLDSLLEDIRSLKTLPFRNPYFYRSYLPAGKYRHMLSSKRYRVIYQVDGDFVFVDDIQDCRQDDDKIILNQ